MQTFSLKPGLIVRHNDRLWRFVKRLVENRLFFSDELAEPWLVTDTEFYRLYEKRELTVELEQKYLGVIPMVTNAPRDLSTFQQAHVDEAFRRKKYVDGLMTYSGDRLYSGDIAGRISEIALTINDKRRPPSPVTVLRWVTAFANRCITKLVPAHGNKGRHRIVTGETEDILLDVINTIYLTPERPPIAKVWAEFRDRIQSRNESVSPSQRLKLPSRSSIYRFVDNLDSYVVDCARLGRRVANQNHRVAATEMQVTEILDRWEIDHTPMDVLVVDLETGKVIGRPYMTVIIDRASRMVMAFLIHLSTPNTETVLRVIDRAIRPKQEWLSRYPAVLCTWLARGLPLRLVPDNAAEFHAGAIYLAFNDLGIELFYPKARGPEMKGAVERFFRTLNTDLLHCLPGTTRSNTKDRGDYPSEKMACLTLPILEGMVLKWVADVYHQKPHRGLRGKTPADVWKAGESARPIHLPADLDALESILAMREERPVHHYGVELSYLRYNSPELGRLRHGLGADEKVEVRYRDELGHVWIYDARRKVFLKVPCTNATVIGMSRDLYDRARKMVRDARGDVDDFSATHRAYKQIMAEVELAKHSKKLRQRREAAKSGIDKEGHARTKTNDALTGLANGQAKPQSLPLDISKMSGFNIRSVDRSTD